MAVPLRRAVRTARVEDRCYITVNFATEKGRASNSDLLPNLVIQSCPDLRISNLPPLPWQPENAHRNDQYASR